MRSRYRNLSDFRSVLEALQDDSDIIQKVRSTLDKLPPDPDYGYALWNQKESHLWVVVGDANENSKEWEDALSKISGVKKFTIEAETPPQNWTGKDRAPDEDDGWTKVSPSAKESFSSVLECGADASCACVGIPCRKSAYQKAMDNEDDEQE